MYTLYYFAYLIGIVEGKNQKRVRWPGRVACRTYMGHEGNNLIETLNIFLITPTNFIYIFISYKEGNYYRKPNYEPDF